MKYLVIAFIAAIAGPLSSAAQSTGAFSRLGFEARGMAMGNALVADASGHTSPYYNPALAPELTGQHLGFSAALMRLDRQLQSVQVGAPLAPRAGVAVGLIHAGVSKIDGRDNSGFHTKNLSTDEFALFMAFGLKFNERIAGGITLQLFRSDLLAEVDAVTSVGVDFGLMVQMTDRLSLGAVVEDLLAKYDWDTSGAFGAGGKTTTDLFPRRVRLGGSYGNPGGQLRVNAELEVAIESLEKRSTEVELVNGIPTQSTTTDLVRRTSSQVRVGAEYYLSSVFAVQGGLDRLGSEAFAGMTPTAGFLLEQPLGNLLVRAGYAFVLEPSATGSVHVLTLRLFL